MIKKFIYILFSIILMSQFVYADDYDSMYDNAKPFESKLYNDIDPFEDEDSLKYAYCPYPLFRTSAYLYFKDYTIEPGYYSLTPRQLKGNDYLLFKQGGKVQFIIPVAKKEKTPLNFYEANLPKVQQTRWQKFATNFRNKFYERNKDSMMAPPPKSVVDVQMEVKYIIVTVYYGEDKYIALFKRTPY